MKVVTISLPLMLIIGLLSEGGAFSTPSYHHRMIAPSLAATPVMQKLSAYRNPSKGRLSMLQQKQDDPELVLGKSMLAGSNLIYSFASLREAVNKAIDDGRRSELDRPELILTRLQENPFKVEEVLPYWKKKFDATRKSPKKAFDSTVLFNVDRALNRYLKHEVPVVDIYDFVINNEDFCNEIPKDKFDTKKVKSTLKRYRDLNLGVFEFDDQFQKSELVFGIMINRTHKRFTVCFRGSVTGTKDWPTNFKLLHTPLAINDTTTLDGLDGKIKVHSGFNGYLNDALEGDAKKYSALREFSLAAAKEYNFFQDQDDGYFADAGRTTKFSKILDNLEYLYSRREFKDYKLFVCGHSLGGALAQLLAFQLASDGRLDKYAEAAYPITAITFASPCVGNEEFRKAYQKLERLDRVRHVRISNEGDAVPVMPPAGYTQTGVHLHPLKDYGKMMEVGYRLVKSCLSQVGSGWSWSFNPFKKYSLSHKTEEYYKRLFDSNEMNAEIMKMSVEDLYDKFAGDKTA